MAASPTGRPVEIPCSITPVGTYRALLGESPVWDYRRSRLLFTDILARRLIVIDPAFGDERTFEFPGGITSLGLADCGGYVATAERSYMLLDETIKVLWRSQDVEPQFPQNRFNDGKVDPFGRYWAGTMQRDLAGSDGSLYCLVGNTPERRDQGYRVTNGPAFSPDGQVMYHTDSLQRVVYQIGIDAQQGRLERRVFVRIPEEFGTPDGMTVDQDGRLYVAHFGGGGISRFLADGTGDGFIRLPVQNVTSVTFGADNFTTLFATSANCTFDESERLACPLEGSVFAIDCNARGLPQPLFSSRDIVA